ncbi:MAG: NAD(P)-binding protein [Bacillota bacterium]|nr:NAD(P)-binding protein [Bacillota bacterium]
MEQTVKYDAAIVGAGMAGLTAAAYLSRAGLPLAIFTGKLAADRVLQQQKP